MLLADADPTGAITGPAAAVVSGLLLLLYVVDKVKAKRAEWRRADAKADAEAKADDAAAVTAVATADELPSRQYQRAAQAAGRRADRLEEKVEHLDARLTEIQAQHHDCEDRFVRQEKQHAAEIGSLKAQNAGQQSQMDRNKAEFDATVAGLLGKIARLEAALRAQNIATGSGPLPKLADDTGEHEPLAPGG